MLDFIILLLIGFLLSYTLLKRNILSLKPILLCITIFLLLYGKYNNQTFHNDNSFSYIYTLLNAFYLGYLIPICTMFFKNKNYKYQKASLIVIILTLLTVIFGDDSMLFILFVTVSLFDFKYNSFKILSTILFTLLCVILFYIPSTFYGINFNILEIIILIILIFIFSKIFNHKIHSKLHNYLFIYFILSILTLVYIFILPNLLVNNSYSSVNFIIMIMIMNSYSLLFLDSYHNHGIRSFLLNTVLAFGFYISLFNMLHIDIFTGSDGLLSILIFLPFGITSIYTKHISFDTNTIFSSYTCSLITICTIIILGLFKNIYAAIIVIMILLKLLLSLPAGESVEAEILRELKELNRK